MIGDPLSPSRVTDTQWLSSFVRDGGDYDRAGSLLVKVGRMTAVPEVHREPATTDDAYARRQLYAWSKARG